MPRSFRTTLTIWNSSILVGTLIAAGLVLAYGSRLELEREIDRDLQDRGNGAARPGPPGPPPFGFGGGPPRPGGPPPPGGTPGPPGFNQRFGGSPPGPAQGFQPGQRQDRAPPPEDNGLRTPRRFDTQGEPQGPPQPGGRKLPSFDAVALKGALAGRGGFSDATFADSPVRVYTVPVFDQGQIVGAVQVARDLSEEQALWSIQSRTLLAFIPISILVGALAALFLTGKALRPIRLLTEAASKINATDLARRLEVTGDDELASLAITFNAMLERLDRAFTELSEAYEHQRRFSADASHELRTPLARIRLATSGALDGPQDPSTLRQALQVASTAAQEMSVLVEQLLTLARADAGRLTMQLESVDLRVLAADVVDEQEGAEVKLRVPDGPAMAKVDPLPLKRALQNVVQNAVRHSEGKPVVVSLLDCGDGFKVVVEDFGEGISPEHLPHLGERFYRVESARTAGGGTGLGLAIVMAIVEAHGGTVSIGSTVGEGTRITLTLPGIRS